jgi:aldose 1-epimerase
VGGTVILLWLRDGLAPLIVAHGRYARVRSPHESYANISTGERSMSAAHLPPVELHEEASALRATFVPAAGMLCGSLRHRGEELLAQNAGVAAYAETGKTMGIPLLYPWANRLAGFDYTVAGRSVSVTHDSTRVRLDAAGLPIHGVIGGRLAWELVDGPDGEGEAEGEGEGEGSSITARLSWSDARPELFEVFPFRHELRYSARLRGGRLEVQLTVEACGEDHVPVSFGLHPYLSLPGTARESWQVELPAMRSLALDARQIPTGSVEPLAAQRFELDGRQFDDAFDGVREPARFSVADTHRRIELTLVEGYSCAQVFAPPSSQFICFEPMTAPANALLSGSGLNLLAPGERYVAGFSVAVSDAR